MHSVVQNLRFALRQLRRSPGFALTAVLTLALGVGANTAIFSLLDQALLRSLPVREPERLVILEGTGKAWQGHTSGHGGDKESYFSYPMYRDLRDHGSSFSGLIATSATDVGVLHNGTSRVEDAELVSGNYFRVLGVQPTLGRLLTDEDDTLNNTNQVAVLSNDFWQSHLGADRSVVGRTLGINGHPFTVIGVAPPAFRSAVWGQAPAVFLPVTTVGIIDQWITRAELSDHTSRWLNVIGRLRDGTNLQSAQVQSAPLWHALRANELDALGKRPPKFVADFLTNSRLVLLPGARGLSYSRDNIKQPLYVVMGMAALLLLIASVNVASLLLVRSAARVREFCLRYALGANTTQIVSQLLLEGLLIGVLGAVTGAGAAPLVVHVLNHGLGSPGDPTLFSAKLDLRLLFFSFAVTLFVSIAFSLLPAMQVLRPDLVGSLKQQGSTAQAGRLSFRRLIVSLQVGLSVLLLMVAGLLIRTLSNLRHADVGFHTDHLLTFHITPTLAGYTLDRIPALHRQALESLSAVPAIQAVAAEDGAELAGSDSGSNVSVEGYTAPPDEDLDIGRITVTPGYFSTLGEPIIAGRAFAETDDDRHPPVVIVNQSFARHYFGSDAAAVGKRMARGAGSHVSWMQIVGVSRDAKHISLRDDVKMTDFIPLLQDPKASALTFYLRTGEAPASVFNTLRLAMRNISPALALEKVRTMDEQVESNLQNERMIGLLATAFGLLATVLAGVGIYGVLAYTTAQRTREIGVRIALGSSRLAVAGLVVRQVLFLVGIGIVIAIPCALLLTRLMRAQLFGVTSTDPVTLTSVTVLMGVVAVIAALIPARRAASVDPTIALRSE